jgi:molybdopterin converting factor small subunit
MPLVRVKVKLGDKETFLEVPEGICVETLLDKLEEKWRNNVLIIINGKAADSKDSITSLDHVLILPLLAGG